MSKDEEKIQIAICQYLLLQYPDVYFMTDASGLRLPMGLAVKAKKQRFRHAQLDLVILEPKTYFHGLILEIKRSEDEVYTKNGEFRKTSHVIEQNESIRHLSDKRYYVRYAFSFDEAINIIDNYMKVE